jgi:hypothetical protein
MRHYALIAIFLAAAAAAQEQKATRRMEIRVELRDSGSWKTVDPATVFDSGAQLRFRLKTNFPGYLYVMNQGTGGDYTQLFPRQDTGEQNRIEPQREYIVPATSGAFRVTGPPGQDIVYWMVTPYDVSRASGQSGYVPLPPPPPPGERLKSLVPRCDDSVFRARGECVDVSAGPRKVQDPATLPKNMQGVEGLRSRELVFIREKEAAVVSTPGGVGGPVVYEFRIAHR